jgi:hypothetical protein
MLVSKLNPVNISATYPNLYYKVTSSTYYVKSISKYDSSRNDISLNNSNLLKKFSLNGLLTIKYPIARLFDTINSYI